MAKSYTEFIEEKRPLPVDKMSLKASDIDQKAEKEKDRDKKFRLFDRARNIRMAQDQP